MNRYESYWEKGFVVVKNAVPKESLQELLRTSVLLLKKMSPEFSVPADEITDWEDERFHRALMQFRESHPVRFGGFYDSLQTSWQLQKFFNHPSFQEIAAELMDEKSVGMATTGYMLRIDVPNDRRNTLDWHQDSSYYFQNKKGDHGLVILVALAKTTSENGAVKALVGSHRSGVIPHALDDKQEYIGSQKFSVPPEHVSNFEFEEIILEPGDAAFCHMDLIHSSGNNCSDQVRLTTGVRVHRMLVDDFVPGRFLYKLNDHFAGEILGPDHVDRLK